MMIGINNDVIRFIQHTTRELSKFIKKDLERSFNKVKIPNGYIYFIFDKESIFINDNLSSFDIEPIGFILDTNGEYYYCNFKGEYFDSEDVVKAFVESCLKDN